jgi:simple sugar transport system ATP-binding protein/ribose transport system ATP-binding protein
MQQTAEPVPHVALDGISKRFGGVQALADISLEIAAGMIHALVGENGAGKSTLGKIVAGVYTPDTGTMLIEGEAVSYHSPRDALADGVTMIAQELMLVPQRSVIENVFLGSAPNRRGVVTTRPMNGQYADLCARAGFDLPAEATVGALRVADQQKVEILRALARDARLIVMDEPTAALTADESERLFDIIRGLRASGTTIVFVSHFLKEVLALSDTVTVLRDGRLIRTAAARDETPESLVTAMLGQSMEVTFPDKAPAPPADAPVVLSVRDLSRRGAIEGVSFDVREGEILGLAGLIGSGRTEVARAIFGADRRDSGEITLDGRALNVRTPRHAIRAGIAMLPESRKDQGLLMRSSITRNVTLPHLTEVSEAGVMKPLGERRQVADMTKRVDVRASHLNAWISTLSGGNQQKVLFAKWLFRRPRVLLADEPTRGVDIGAKRTIYELIQSLAASGMAVVLISSEVEEVLGLAHRVLVLRGGAVVAELDGDEATEDDVLHAAFATGGVDR